MLERAPASRTLTKTASLAGTISEIAVNEVEAQRMRGLMTGIASSSALTAAIVIGVGGDPTATAVHAGALTGSAVASGIAALLFRNPKRYHPKLALYIVIAQLGVLLTGYYFWGIFSAYLAIMPLSIYIAVGTATRTEAILGVIGAVLAQGGFQLATIFGWIESRGLVEPVAERTPLSTQIVAIVLLNIITIGAAIAGRAARRDTVAVLDKHNQALLELAQREAQLAEAVADAHAAREAAIGAPGRFTDQVVDGYKIGVVLGRGAMGEIYEAIRVSDNVQVAFKILAPHLLRERAARERFVRECKIVSALTSPHVVRVYAVSPPNAAMPYIAMEKLVGTDLAQLIKRKEVSELSDIRELIVQIASGLDAAHHAGIVHRDIKPSNIFATGDGVDRVWKLLDFGASKWSDGEATLTRDNIVGTPGYMAPEQAMGKKVDVRSDVYALGVILYRLVTGVPAVVPSDVPSMLQEVAFRMPPQPSKRGKVSSSIETVLAVALAKNSAQRFASAGELALAFSKAVDGRLGLDIVQRAEAVLVALPWGAWQKR